MTLTIPTSELAPDTLGGPTPPSAALRLPSVAWLDDEKWLKQAADDFAAKLDVDVIVFRIRRSSASHLTQSESLGLRRSGRVYQNAACEATCYATPLASSVLCRSLQHREDAQTQTADLELAGSVLADQISAACDDRQVITLAAGRGRRIALIIALTQRRTATQIDDLLRYATHWAEQIGRLIEVYSDHRNAKAWRTRGESLRSRKALAAVASAAAIIIGGWSIPLPYNPQRPCTFEQSDRRIVSSPIDGTLKEVYVRPGDVVAEGQLLAALDDELMLHDLEGAQAEVRAAQKRRDTALAARDGGEFKAAVLQEKQAAAKIGALEEGLQKLQIRSPVAGTLVSGDWRTKIDGPVRVGESLFEVSSLKHSMATLQLEPTDLGDVRVGNRVWIDDPVTGSRVEGTVAQIDPRASTEGDRCYFAADVALSPDAITRPGLTADGWVQAGRRTLADRLFDRPYRWLRDVLTW